MNTPVIGLAAANARGLARDIEVQRLLAAANHDVSPFDMTPVIAFTEGTNGRLAALVYFKVSGARSGDYPDPRQHRS